jgi:hypothetical protein
MPAVFAASPGDIAHLAFAIWKLCQAYKHLQPSTTVLIVVGLAVAAFVAWTVYRELAKPDSSDEQKP